MSSDGQPWASQTKCPCLAVAAGDFDGDSTPDLVVTYSSGVGFLLAKGDGTFGAAVNYLIGVGDTLPVGVGDFNGDAKQDVVLSDGFGVFVLLNTCAPASVGLGVSRDGGKIKISWPFPSAGFVLESATSLLPPDWNTAPEPQRVNASQLEVISSIDIPQRYFRLRKQ